MPLALRVVNAAVDGVVNPMAVLLIPVEVVLKLWEVMVKSFVPDRLILDAESSDRDNAPPVPEILTVDPLILTAPLVTVNPLEAVNSPAEVIVPVPVVVKLPLVVAFPYSSIVKLSTPLDWITKALLVALVLVSLTAIAAPVP